MIVAAVHSAAATANQTIISGVTPTGAPSQAARTYVVTERASDPSTAASSAIVAIMNTKPPNDVGICAAFSVSNCGWSAPNPSAMAPIASVSAAIVAKLRIIMNGPTLSSALVRPVSSMPSTSSGTVPTQYLDQSNALRSSGDERNSHICRPSSDTAGKMKRAAIDGRQKWLL